jgi:hypothetical protein
VDGVQEENYRGPSASTSADRCQPEITPASGCAKAGCLIGESERSPSLALLARDRSPLDVQVPITGPAPRGIYSLRGNPDPDSDKPDA